MNTAPTVALESDRQSTRHLRARPRGVMRKMNSSGTALGFTPAIFAPKLEKSRTTQDWGELPSISQSVADEFHSARKVFRRSPLIGSAPREIHQVRGSDERLPNVKGKSGPFRLEPNSKSPWGGR
jgi:hypothetical protein